MMTVKNIQVVIAALAVLVAAFVAPVAANDVAHACCPPGMEMTAGMDHGQVRDQASEKNASEQDCTVDTACDFACCGIVTAGAVLPLELIKGEHDARENSAFLFQIERMLSADSQLASPPPKA